MNMDRQGQVQWSDRADRFPDLGPGIVLHLDPDELERLGGRYTGGEVFRVQGGHFFLCLDDDGSVGHWLPLFSKPGTGRFLLTGQRHGHIKWTGVMAYYHPGQVWIASHDAIVGAAESGRDRSTPAARNRLDVVDLPRLPQLGLGTNPDSRDAP